MTATIRLAVPADPGGTAVSRFNALRHGVLSRYTVLPWEEADEYEGLVAALVAEHAPQGPTEEHLVEELAGILWRKRRLRLAEAAAYRRGLNDALAPRRETAQVALVHLAPTRRTETVGDAVRATAADTAEDLRDTREAEAMARRALAQLGSGDTDAYETALALLGDETRGWWVSALARDPGEPDEGEEPATADVAGLQHFLEAEILPWFEAHQADLADRPLIREQAFGEALDPDRLERLGRYEVHLDRKLERTLGMLVRLKALRQDGPAG